jgi:hypothetical protein
MNITDRPGYDNQPSFSDDEQGIFFASVRDDAQADIYRPTSRRSARPVSPSPRRKASTRRRRSRVGRSRSFVSNAIPPSDCGDSARRRNPTVILERVRPVGYHAWADEHTLALFVLGSPNTLQLANTRTGKSDTIATNIGRSLHRIPGTNRVSFVRKVAPGEWWIEALDPPTRETTRLMRLPDGVEDYAWLPSGSILCGRDSKLLWWSGKRGADWREIADLAPAGAKGITRLAVSARGDQLAFVADGRIAAR